MRVLATLRASIEVAQSDKQPQGGAGESPDKSIHSPAEQGGAGTHYAFRVSRNCFYPTPKVDSVVVTFTLKEPPDVDVESFFELVRTAFQQRRKMIKNTLAPLFGVKPVVDALEKVGINLKARPEELALDLFLALYEKLSNFKGDL